MRSGWGGEIGGVYSLTAVRKTAPGLKRRPHAVLDDGQMPPSDASSISSFSSGDTPSYSHTVNNENALR